MKREISLLPALLAVVAFQFCGTATVAQMPLLAPLPKTGSLSKPADDTKFAFVLAGDNRPAHASCPQPPTPGKIFAAVKAMNPTAAFVLWTGDTISGKDPKNKTIHAQYKEFLDIAATAGVPVFNAPGNHEMDDEKNLPSSEMKAFYRRYMAGTYGGFDYGNSRFIALDSENEPAATTASRPLSTAEGESKAVAPGAITQKQLALLKKDLHESKNKAHIIIFMHHPVVPYDTKDGLDQASVAALQKIFAGYKNVSYVVSGHEHLYFNSQGKRKKLTFLPHAKILRSRLTILSPAERGRH